MDTTQKKAPSQARRSCLLALGALAAASALPARAQDYPTRPIRWIVPYAPGATTDNIARIIAEYLSEALGQPIIVDNRPGGASTIGIRGLLNAPSDGYTLALADDATLYNNWHLFPDLPYSPDNFAYVAMLGRSPLVLFVDPSNGLKTFDEFIQWAKANTGKVNYATPGIATPHHLGMAALDEHFQLGMQPIHYKGSAAAITDTIAGRVQVLLAGSSGFAMQHANEGRIAPLAVSSPERLAWMPTVPSLKEVGFDSFDMTADLGVIMHKDTPAEITQRLGREINAILERPEVRERLQNIGVLSTPLSQADFKAHVRARSAAAGDLIRRAKIQLGNS